MKYAISIYTYIIRFLHVYVYVHAGVSVYIDICLLPNGGRSVWPIVIKFFQGVQSC